MLSQPSLDTCSFLSGISPAAHKLNNVVYNNKHVYFWSVWIRDLKSFFKKRCIIKLRVWVPVLVSVKCWIYWKMKTFLHVIMCVVLGLEICLFAVPIHMAHAAKSFSQGTKWQKLFLRFHLIIANGVTFLLIDLSFPVISSHSGTFVL